MAAAALAATAPDLEPVLVVPKRLTKIAHDVLMRSEGTKAMPWNLKGRYGSRTHVVDDEHMGLPVAGIEEVRASDNEELREILDDPEVSIRMLPISPSKSAREPPHMDGRMHPEREGEEGEEMASAAELSFTYAEMFAGIGGFGIALDRLGGKCIFSSEIEPSCRNVYEKNVQLDDVVLVGDIYSVSDSKLPSSGSLDLLVGGFPCQPFSRLGEQPGFDCPSGRGHLFLEVVRVLRVSRPRAFLLENVPGLTELSEELSTIVDALEDAGYNVVAEVCSARGVTATNRKRLFFAGHRKDQCEACEKAFQFPFVPDLSIRAVDVIDYRWPYVDEFCCPDDPQMDYEQLLPLAPTTFQQLLSSRKFRPAHLAWPNVICGTLTSHYGNAVGRGDSQLVPTPSSAPTVRRLSPRECARIMGFPRTFRFADRAVSTTYAQSDMAYVKEQFRMVGNAVCPPLIAALAGAVLAHGDSPGWILRGRAVAVRMALEALWPDAESWKRQPIAPGLTVPPGFHERHENVCKERLELLDKLEKTAGLTHH